MTKTFDEERVTATVAVGRGVGDIAFGSLYFDCPLSDVPAFLRNGVQHEICVVAENVNVRVRAYDPDRFGVRGYTRFQSDERSENGDPPHYR